MKENKRFAASEITVIRFNAKDIITTSEPEDYNEEQRNNIPGEEVEVGNGTQ